MSPFTSETGKRRAVAFSIQPDEEHIEKPPLERTRRSRLKMAKKVYEKYDATQVTDDMMQEASKMFSEHYGIWGKKAASTIGAFAKEGKLVRSIIYPHISLLM